MESSSEYVFILFILFFIILLLKYTHSPVTCKLAIINYYKTELYIVSGAWRGLLIRVLVRYLGSIPPLFLTLVPWVIKLISVFLVNKSMASLVDCYTVFFRVIPPLTFIPAMVNIHSVVSSLLIAYRTYIVLRHLNIMFPVFL